MATYSALSPGIRSPSAEQAFLPRPSDVSRPMPPGAGTPQSSSLMLDDDGKGAYAPAGYGYSRAYTQRKAGWSTGKKLAAVAAAIIGDSPPFFPFWASSR
jgi:hypothetical protein